MENTRTRTAIKTLFFLLLLTMLLAVSASMAFGADFVIHGDAWPVTGSAGPDCTFNCYADGTVVIKGTGSLDRVPRAYDSGETIAATTNLVIPKGITEIGRFACSHLKITSISIPETVTSVGDNAFSYCDNLESVTIPETVTSVGDNAFSYCNNLESVTIAGNFNLETENGYEWLNWPFKNCPKLKKAVVLDGVTSLNATFGGCSALTDISLPDTLTYVGKCAFQECTALTEFSLPDSVTSIGFQAFTRCTGLTDISIPNGVTSIGEAAFWGCSNLEDFIVPYSVTSIGKSAFWGCSSLACVTFTGDTISIGDSAFKECPELMTINLPDSIETIGPEAFKGCVGLISVEIPNQVEKIEYSTFEGCSSLYTVTIPKSVKSIDAFAFYDCSSLAYVYYRGSLRDWKKIEYDKYENEYYTGSNHDLQNAKLVYDYGVGHVHSYKSTVTTPATCTKEGVKTFTCSCGASYTEAIPINPDNHAKLDENGDCPRCGKHIKDVEKPTEPSDEKPAEKLNFFQRIIQWFKNLFAKLFGR